MREIKFRAWDKKYSEMLNITSISWLEDKFFEFGFFNPENKRAYGERDYLDRFVIMQLTNLHDKNGKEIWEGDIVKPIYSDGKLSPHKDEQEVEFSDGAFYPFHDDQCTASRTIIAWEVLGNIYENPELLK